MYVLQLIAGLAKIKKENKSKTKKRKIIYSCPKNDPATKEWGFINLLPAFYFPLALYLPPAFYLLFA